MPKVGSAFAIVIDGVSYSSMFKASIETGISYKTLWLKIKERNGAPTTARGIEIHSKNHEIGLKIMEENAMSDTNVIIVEGRLTKNAEMSSAGSSSVVKFSIASNKSVKKDGEWKNYPSFFDCELWGKYGEAMYSHLLKGVMLTVTGQLRQDTWKDSNGDSHSRVKIVADNLSIRFQSKNSVPDTSFEPVTDEANPYDEPTF